MPIKEIVYKGRVLRPRRATTDPDFAAETVLVSDPWDYVELWLKREKQDDAREYWRQAREFSRAAEILPFSSAPLPAYYCFLNAVKALLAVRGEATASAHGVSGTNVASGRSLDKEKVTFKSSGVLAGLCRVLGETTEETSYSLKDALYNLPFIHRAYCLTFTSRSELYFPIREPRFVRKLGSNEAWFCAELEPRYAVHTTVGKLGPEWELDVGAAKPGTIRLKKRFKWDSKRPSAIANKDALRAYHKRVRGEISYIFGPSRLWYVKRSNSTNGSIKRSPLTLTFAIMHRLSELSRYEPLTLRQHMERQHNWLLSEFVAVSPRQFIDEIASELTGCDFMIPGIRR